MLNVFDHYRVTRDLLKERENFEPWYKNSSKSSVAEIASALRHIVPRHSGFELIRVGSKADGGYLVPDDLAEIEACFSPGVNNFKDFEDQLTTRHGIKALMCDYSSDVAKLRTPLIAGMQVFEKKWLDVTANEHHLDINDWVQHKASTDSDLILQMDIEGAEYRNLLHASAKTLSRFRILVIELHGLQNLASIGFLRGIFLPAIARLPRSQRASTLTRTTTAGLANSARILKYRTSWK